MTVTRPLFVPGGMGPPELMILLVVLVFYLVVPLVVLVAALKFLDGRRGYDERIAALERRIDELENERRERCGRVRPIRSRLAVLSSSDGRNGAGRRSDGRNDADRRALRRSSESVATRENVSIGERRFRRSQVVSRRATAFREPSTRPLSSDLRCPRPAALRPARPRRGVSARLS